LIATRVGGFNVAGSVFSRGVERLGGEKAPFFTIRILTSSPSFNKNGNLVNYYMLTKHDYYTF